MDCTVVYGMSRTIRHEETMSPGEAFALIPKLYGYSYIDIYYADQLVYTTQGLAGYAFICPMCPYQKD